MPKTRERMNDEQFEIFRQNLTSLRKDAGLTAKELCEMIGISHSYISNIENGRDKPSLALAEKIADAFGLPLKDMYISERDRKREARRAYGRSLMKKRMNKGLTLSTVAGALGTTVAVYKEVEAGDCSVSDSWKRTLAVLYGEDKPAPVKEEPKKVEPTATIPDEIVDVILKHVTDLNVSTDIQKRVVRYFSEVELANRERRLFG